MFNAIGAKVVSSGMSGYNTTIFAYGQTGSGKSYTMMGNPTSDTHRGLIPRISMSLFEQIEAAKHPTLAAETGTGEDADVSSHWISGLDPNSGHEYWYNTVTEESSWTKPLEQPVSKTNTSSSTLNPDQDVHYRVECSYLEIYNEQVRDLLANANANEDPSKTPEHRAFGIGKQKSASTMLKVREHPKNGPYVEGLKTIAVENYNDIDELITIGGACRVVASTQMNTESSRSHAIFKIRFTRTTVDHAAGKATDRVADINLGTNNQRWRREQWPNTHQQLITFFVLLFLFLSCGAVDLAGSERAKKSGAKGTRLREAAAINKSLSTLGQCINKLSEGVHVGNEKGKMDRRSNSRKKHQSNSSKHTQKQSAATGFVPYRDSILTWLLKESFGGNAKTIMLATIRPSAAYYEETMVSHCRPLSGSSVLCFNIWCQLFFFSFILKPRPPLVYITLRRTC